MELSRRLLELSIGILKVLGLLLWSALRRLLERYSRLYLYKPRPDDIFLVTFPKSGTTLMQMMLYQLTTRGEMDFPHINSVAPWFECLHERPDLLPNVDKAPSPRYFKCHLTYEKAPRNGKLIYVARDAQDVAVSSYYHQRILMALDREFEPFVDDFLAGKSHFGSWFEHIESWWPHRNDPNVLFLRYEEIIADLEGTIRQVARFCNITLDEADVPRIVERCGFDFMKRYNAKFDPRQRGAEHGQFIRKGSTGEGKSTFTPEQQRRLAERLEKMAGKLGCTETESFAPLLRPQSGLEA